MNIFSVSSTYQKKPPKTKQNKNQRKTDQQNQNNPIKNKVEENLFPYSDKLQATLVSCHGKPRWISFH